MQTQSKETSYSAYPSAVHYGPVWNKSRKVGDSFAACNNDENHGTLTTHLPWVTCPACKALSPSSVCEAPQK